MYRKSFETLIDISKGITAGLFVAAMVGFLIQEKSSSWFLLLGFLTGLTITMLLAIFYDRRFTE